MAFPYTFPFSFVETTEHRRSYQLEVRDADGSLVRILGRVIAADVDYRINEPSMLSLRISDQEEASGSLKGANHVWLRDQDDNIEAKFLISKTSEEVDSDGRFLQVEAMDRLSQLADEQVVDYQIEEESSSGAPAAGPISDTIQNHLTDWFANYQKGAHPLTLGTIHTDIGSLTRAVEVRRTQSILSLIQSLEETMSFASRFYVDTDGAFQWTKMTDADYAGKQLVVTKNMTSLERETNYAAQATRIYAFGENDGGDLLRLNEADSSTQDYIDATWAEYQYRKQITIHYTDDAIDPTGHTNYSLNYVRDADIHLAAHAASDGSDIIFLDDDLETQLSATINSFDSSTGALDATVMVPSVSGVKNTIIYMIYGGQ